MKILLAGATGLVGSELRKKLLSEGHSLAILSRSPKVNTASESFHVWNPTKNEIDTTAFDHVDAVINLAGAGVADKRWTAAYKQEILSSRVLSTRLLVETLKAIPHKVKTFINASAIGIYGYDTGNTLVDENTPTGNDYLANVVKDWEKEAFEAQKQGIRTIAIRIGIVLSHKGGALVTMAKPVKYWLGAALGSGNQYISWIDINDLINELIFILKTDSISGIVNAVAPNPVTNKEFNRLLAKQLGTKILLPNVPSFALNLLLGEFSAAVIGGNKVSGQLIESKGFEFEYKELSESLMNKSAILDYF